MVDYLLWLGQIAGLAILGILVGSAGLALLARTGGRAWHNGRLMAEHDERARRARASRPPAHRNPPPPVADTINMPAVETPQTGALCVVGHYVPLGQHHPLRSGEVDHCIMGHRMSHTRTAAAGVLGVEAAARVHIAALEQTAQRQASGGW